ncbi:hypothetical protein [Roseibium sediminicola]|uniref:Uncharacterized protein n=1 Tax=Roseibium sediminicola TaxID=2933272 RepID=A0ABT0H2L4_9HYPH|nr:hypothetical protein [Roseibium sp. CAU 1639]
MTEGRAGDFRAHPFTLHHEPFGKFRIDVFVSTQEITAPKLFRFLEIGRVAAVDKFLDPGQIGKEQPLIKLDMPGRGPHDIDAGGFLRGFQLAQCLAQRLHRLVPVRTAPQKVRQCLARRRQATFPAQIPHDCQGLAGFHRDRFLTVIQEQGPAKACKA